MWPSSWECVSPDTCVRCANAVDDQTCLYNKFTCLCDYGDGSGPCVHQEIIDEHKSKLAARHFPSNRSSMPSTSAFIEISEKRPKKSKRKRKTKKERQQTAAASLLPNFDDEHISETKNLLPLDTPEQEVSQSTNLLLPLSVESTYPQQVDTLRCSGSSTSSSSDMSSSSTSSSSGSSSSRSSSTSTSSTDGSSTSDSNNNELFRRKMLTEMERKDGYTMIDETESNDCDNSDCDDSTTAASTSDDDSTSASSDDRWWQRYERLRNATFVHKGDAVKDSGYVSMTSPNTESSKADEIQK